MYLVVLVVILSDVSLQTPFSSIPDTVINACDTDQLEVTTNPIYINSFTNEIYCSFLVNMANGAAISVSVFDSNIDNAFTYFYIEIIERQILNNAKKINVISLDSTPCVAMLQGNQFKFHFQNTNIRLRLCNKICYEPLQPLMATQCRVTAYGNEIHAREKRQTFVYGYSKHVISEMINQFNARCACDCPDTCKCTLGYRQWLSRCTNTIQTNNKPAAELVVYKPNTRGLSFNKTGLPYNMMHF